MPVSDNPSFPVSSAFYSCSIGKLKVTAIRDGGGMLNPEMFSGLPAAQIDQIIAPHVTPAGKLMTDLNVFLIELNQKKVLVDAGRGHFFEDKRGNLQEVLVQLACDPETIDVVLLTHLHGDHIGGLTDASGKASFPRAQVYAHAREAAFWLSEKRMQQADWEMQARLKRIQQTLAPYQQSGQWQLFESGMSVVEGVDGWPLPGHTPGHTGYVIEAQGERLVIMGDLIHNLSLQLSCPQVSIHFDADAAQAVLSRQRFLAQAAQAGIWVAGMHMPFPGMGRVVVNPAWPQPAYDWIPVSSFP